MTPRARAGGDLGTHLDEVVYPALFERLDQAFPDFDWKRKGDGTWEATRWPATFPLPVEHENPARLMVYRNRPWWIKVHGHAGVRFLDLVNGGRKPDGPDYVPAVRRLCEAARVPFPEREVSPEEAERIRKREARRSALEAVMVRAQEVLFTEAGRCALAYLCEERGFTEDEVRALGLGYYDAVTTFEKALEAEGQDLGAAKDAALLWPKLEGYVLIPWADAGGHPLTLYGRWAGKTPPDGRPKTLALPGEGTKASPLYFDRARDAGQHRDLVAVEGVFDAALLQVRGDARVVAYVAAQFSGAQVDTLVRHKVRSVVICPDPDGGGDRGALASVDALTRAGIVASVTPRLPDGLDPDEFLLREGLDGWRGFVNRAVSGAVYHAQSLIGNVSSHSPDMDRRRVVDEVLAYEATLRGPRAGLDRADLLRLLTERTGYTPEALLPLAEDFQAKRQKEETEKALAAALRDAQAAAATRPALEVFRDLSAAYLATIQAHTVDTPPPFSVDRLDAETRAVPEGLASGWAALDRLEVRFNAGELAVLGGRTGHAKTAVLVGLLRNWLRVNTDALLVFYSSEEAEVRVYHRLLALLTAEHGDGWTANEVRDFLRDPRSRDSWRGHPNTLDAAREALRGLQDRLRVVHRPSWSVDDIVAHARTLAEREPVDAVLVDYLQRIPPPAGTHERRDLEVSATARGLRTLALAAGVPVVVGAQINREAVRGAEVKPGDYADKQVQASIRTRRPKLHHLREGGSEQEADLVLGLLNYRADFEQDEDAPGTVPEVTRLEVGLLKSRYGPVGTWTALAFDGRCGLIRDPKDWETL